MSQPQAWMGSEVGTLLNQQIYRGFQTFRCWCHDDSNLQGWEGLVRDPRGCIMFQSLLGTQHLVGIEVSVICETVRINLILRLEPTDGL